jgi:hypothetical protein
VNYNRVHYTPESLGVGGEWEGNGRGMGGHATLTAIVMIRVPQPGVVNHGGCRCQLNHCPCLYFQARGVELRLVAEGSHLVYGECGE